MACHHMILFSKFISKSLLKCLLLEMSSDLLFKRFIPWCVSISNFPFKQRLQLSIAQLAVVHLRTIFMKISALFVAFRFHTSFESSILFWYCSFLNHFLCLVNCSLKVVSELLLAFFLYWVCVFINKHSCIIS